MLRTTLANTLTIAALLAWGCAASDEEGERDASADGESDGVISGDLTPPPECATPFPAFGCAGNPIGTWQLVGLCFETYPDCAGASVSITGSLQASLNIGGDGIFSHDYDLDYESRLSVPASCLDGGSCDSIDCFGTTTCACNLGTGSGGFQSGDWTMVAPGRVAMETSNGHMELCAGDDYADSTGGGLRRIWRRVSELCAEGAACDDGLACTQDYCANDIGACANIPVPTGGPEGWLTDPACDNGLDDDCDGFIDIDDPDCLTEPCTAAADCSDDGNPCTVTSCDSEGFCRTADAPDGTICPGSDACTNTYLCRRDQCVAGPATLDVDVDGFVDAACQFGSDCDDNAIDIHFGAEGPRGDASCGDGIDNDCDDIIDVYDADCWPAICNENEWCLEEGRPLAEDLNDLWAPGPDDVWAVGDFGHILHWDGTGWARDAQPSSFALESVCGCGADDGWAVGATGDVFHREDNAWTQVDTPSGGPTAYYAVGCLCDDLNATEEVWAVGRAGDYSVFDGETWMHDDHPTIVGDLTGVWLPAAGEAWVVGEEGALSHYVDGAWQDANSGETVNLYGIWGAASDRIWAVGQVGTFLVYDGGDWSSPLSLANNAQLFDIWGLDDDRLWIAGEGALLDYDTVLDAWNQHELDIDPPTLLAVRGFGPQDMWAVGQAGAIVHIDDLGPPTRNGITTTDLLGVCGTQGAGDTERIWAVGFTEQGFFLRDEGGWQMIPGALGERMRDIYCAGSYGVFAVGGQSWVRWGDGIFEGGVLPDIELTDGLVAMDGRIGEDSVELFAVGDSGLLARYDGQTWTTEYLFSSSATIGLQDVWVSPDPQAVVQAVAVAEAGFYLVFDGTTWTTTDLDLFQDFNAVWGDGQGGIWAVGTQGLVQTWTGAAFEALDIGAGQEYLHDVTGTGPNDVWILGEDNMWTFDGDDWTSEPMDLAQAQSLYVTSTDVWAVGRHGAVLHLLR